PLVCARAVLRLIAGRHERDHTRGRSASVSRVRRGPGRRRPRCGSPRLRNALLPWPSSRPGVGAVAQRLRNVGDALRTARAGGEGHAITGNVIAGGKVWLMGTTACEVRANYQHGLRWGAGIEVQGGAEHLIAENECRDDLCAIKCVETVGARIERNRYETRWFGIHLLQARMSKL